MASGLTIAVANVAVRKLGEIVLNEASLLLNFKKDFEWLENKLSYISRYLQDADEVTGHSGAVKKWLADVTDIAFDAQDIIDEYAVEPLYTNTSQSCVCCFGQLVFRYKMGKRIKDLKDRMSSTVQKAQELQLVHHLLHLNKPSSSTSERERVESILETDPRAVAMKDKVEEIVRLLEDSAVGVVAVVGMGGLGKTFLLQHVYDTTKHGYEHSAWISVSQTCSLTTLQSDLASNIKLQMDNGISDFRAAQLIHDKLEGKRCLIVLDDVWRTSVDGNLIQRLGLPTGSNKQCKIIFTTRSRDVASNMSDHIYELQHLSEENSWNLFCLFAFPGLEGNRRLEQLESLARQIVEECGRLPLAVKTVAASMANSSLSSEWESKLRQLKEIENAEDSTMKILKLSYNSLPSNLKSCFAYFSFFPEDSRISVESEVLATEIYQNYLIYLWIAEGFIPQEKGKEQFDIGLNYLQQLIDLCLVDVNNRLFKYTVHDLLHDLVINISKDHKCEFDLPVKETSCRRLLLPKKGITTIAISKSSLHCQRLLRTISFSHNPELTSIPEHLFDRLKVLRVLDFSRTAISTVPKCVGKLKLLMVLNLSHTKIMEVPDCVRRLKSLQFLDVSRCSSIQRVPDWIGELKCLSYLDIKDCSKELTFSHMPKGISMLSSLRTLRTDALPLTVERNEFLNVEDVGNLINLQEVTLDFKDEGGLRSVEDGILERLVKMRILRVWNDIPATEVDIEESNLPAFPEKMNVMKDLQQLVLLRFSVPSWICGMVNLTKLTLYMCSDYPSLQNMPNLQILNLMSDWRCRDLPKMFGECGGFPKLVRLSILEFPLLEELPALEDGAMQCLQLLGIRNCPRVKKVPKGLERSTRLKEIWVRQASGELVERLKEGGEDWKKIKANNPHIEIILY